MDYGYDYGGGGGFLAGLGIFSGILSLAIAVVMIVSLWKIFEKAGKPGWAAIIPFYNIWIMIEITGKPPWWIAFFIGLVLSWIPVLGQLIAVAAFVVNILIVLEMAKCFNKTTGFAVGMILLPFIFYPMLAFSDAQYTAPDTQEQIPEMP